MSRQIGDRAVVLGASLAGLLAARVLADAYAEVTVIDRDQLPEASGHRRGVPHGRHAHGGSQGFKSPHLHPTLTTSGNAGVVGQGSPGYPSVRVSRPRRGRLQ
jgi:glycine/D-amino acid oxidase-like deaminating enzyme